MDLVVRAIDLNLVIVGAAQVPNAVKARTQAIDACLINVLIWIHPYN